mgnify:CR=1 FL=1|jgi:uncharacterized protein
MDAYSLAQSGAGARTATRADFIRRTYLHLAGAILAFLALEYYLLNTPAITNPLVKLAFGSRYGWLGLIGGFAVGGWLARSFAANVKSTGAQYFGLALYVVLEALIFVPLIVLAVQYDKSGTTLKAAGIMTTMLFAGLTGIALTSKRNFSFMRSYLVMGGFIALGLIVLSIMIGFTLGIVFSGAMIVLACGAILYDTSRIMHEFDTSQHVAASLELFASVALLLWYVLRLLMALNRR